MNDAFTGGGASDVDSFGCNLTGVLETGRLIGGFGGGREPATGTVGGGFDADDFEEVHGGFRACDFVAVASRLPRIVSFCSLA